MSDGRLNIRHVTGGINIALLEGGSLLIGRPHLFQSEFREAIERDRPEFTNRILRNIYTFAVNPGHIFEVLTDVDGWIWGPISAKGAAERVARHVENGTLLAFVLPPTTLADVNTDAEQLGAGSVDLEGAGGVNVEITVEGTRITDLPEFSDRLVYVLKKCPDYMNWQKVGKAFKEAMTATVIISTAVVLAAWAASHFFGVGFAIDAVLIAIGWIMIGWGIFSAAAKMLKALKKIKNATNMTELNEAAEMFADAVIGFGVDTLIGLLTRGAGKLKRMGSGNQPNASGGTNSGVRVTRNTQNSQTSRSFENSSQHPGDHNNPDLKVHYSDYNNNRLLNLQEGQSNFNTSRKVELDNLSPEDTIVRRALEQQGRSDDEIQMLLESSTGNNSVVRPISDGETFYGFQNKEAPMKAGDNMFWIDEKGFKDVESKFFKGGAWDRQGVKTYLALPCHNSVDTINTGTLPHGTKGNVVETIIGEATETLPIRDKAGRFFSRQFNVMSGGGTQVTPPPGIIVTPIGG